MAVSAAVVFRVLVVLVGLSCALGCATTPQMSPRYAILHQIPAFESFGPAAVELLEALDEAPPQRARITSLYMLHDGRWIVRDRCLNSDGDLTVIDRLIRLDREPQSITVVNTCMLSGLEVQFEILVDVVRAYATRRDDLSISSANALSLHIWMGHSADGEVVLDSFNLPERIWGIPGSRIGVARDVPDSVLLEVYVRLFDSKYSFDISQYDLSPFGRMHD